MPFSRFADGFIACIFTPNCGSCTSPVCAANPHSINVQLQDHQSLRRVLKYVRVVSPSGLGILMDLNGRLRDEHTLSPIHVPIMGAGSPENVLEPTMMAALDG